MRNIEGYNEKIEEYEKLNMPIPNPIWKPGDTMDKMPPPLEKLSYIVVIVDEFAAMHGMGMSGCTTPSTARVRSSMRTIETTPW